jgi:chitinase
MSTDPPRNVIYCNDTGFLQQIVSLPYTDVILNFLAPGGGGTLTSTAGIPAPGDVQALQNAGKNVLISLGGDSTTFPTGSWQQYATGVSDLVNQVAAFVRDNGLNGVDIDYEDGDNGFTGPNAVGVYDGVQFLIDLTNGLAGALPPGQNIITHAPQPPYLDPNGGYNPPGGTAPYAQIWQAAGNNITWLNCQFYNNPDYDKSADVKVAAYKAIADNVTGAAKLLSGAPVTAIDAGTGYLPLDTFTGQVIAPLRQAYPGAFGGVMGWTFKDDQGGTWANGIAQALYQQHVFYVGKDGNLHHVYWDPAAGINADQWTSDGQVLEGTRVATLRAGGQQHVFYTGDDRNVHHAYWDPAAGINHDQWTSDGSVAANVATLLAGAQQHVFYTGADLNVHHVYWDPAAGINHDQWTNDGSVAGDVATLLAGAQQHVFYIGNDRNVHHVYWDPAAGINHDQWTSDGQAIGNVATLLAGAQQHVFYIGNDRNVHHVYWDPAAGINHDQWTSDGQVQSNLATLLAGAQQHVFYTGADLNVHHVYWDPAAGINADQWTFDGQVASEPAVLLAGAQQHVFYSETDQNVHHVYWDPAAGINADQWTFDGQVASEMTTLLTG